MAVRTTSAADNELAPGESNVELLLTDVLVARRGVGSSGRRVNWELILNIGGTRKIPMKFSFSALWCGELEPFIWRAQCSSPGSVCGVRSSKLKH